MLCNKKFLIKDLLIKLTFKWFPSPYERHINLYTLKYFIYVLFTTVNEKNEYIISVSIINCSDN